MPGDCGLMRSLPLCLKCPYCEDHLTELHFTRDSFPRAWWNMPRSDWPVAHLAALLGRQAPMLTMILRGWEIQAKIKWLRQSRDTYCLRVVFGAWKKAGCPVLLRYEGFAYPVVRLLLGRPFTEVLSASACTPSEPRDQWLSFQSAQQVLPLWLWERCMPWRAWAKTNPDLSGVVSLRPHQPAVVFFSLNE